MRSSRSSTAEGIVLKRKSVGEADRILTIFTKDHGKLRLMAKGIRKIHSRRAAHLEIFNTVRFVYTASRPMDILTEVERVGFSSITHIDLQSIAGAYYICELVDALLPEKMEHPEVYELLLRAIKALQADKQDIVIREFPKLLLVILGYFPKGEVPAEHLDAIIEGLIEKRLKSPKFISQIL